MDATALHAAVWNNKKEIVELLLQHGANVNATAGELVWNKKEGDREIERDVGKERREEGTKRTMINLDEGKDSTRSKGAS